MSEAEHIQWLPMSLSEAVEINPKRLLPRQGIVPFLDMASLPLKGAAVSVTEERPVSSGGARFRAGDTLFARITPCAENGKLGFVESVVDDRIAQGSTEFIVMAAREGVTVPEYVRCLAGWSHVRRTAIGLMEGTSGRQRVPISAFEEIDLDLPSCCEQLRIAEVLRSVDEHIAATFKALVAARATKNATLEMALSADWSETTVEELLADTRYPMRSGPFGSALLKSELQADGVPFLGIDNVQVEQFVPVFRRFISEEKYQKLARYTVFPDDVMVTIMGTVGRCCVVPPDIGTAISSKHVWTITLDRDRYSPSLLAWQINHSSWVTDQLQKQSQGGVMSAISSGTLRELVIPIPPPSELREIEQLLLSFNEGISTIEAELDQAWAMREAIADDLLSGRVRVPA